MICLTYLNVSIIVEHRECNLKGIPLRIGSCRLYLYIHALEASCAAAGKFYRLG